MARSYRSRLEVLHDFLDASRRASHKTRIIGLANLNPGYFDRYARFCLDHQLLERSTEGYRPTDRGSEVLVAIRRVLSKTSELDDAMRTLGIALRRDSEPREAFDHVGPAHPPDAWPEMLLHSVARLSIPPPGFTYRSGAAHDAGALEARTGPSPGHGTIVSRVASRSHPRYDSKPVPTRLRVTPELAS
jgi:predicted transcriptional regulator